MPIPRNRHAMRVKEPPELPRIRWPDADRGRGRTGHPPAAQKALKIDHQIEPAPPKRARKPPHREHRSRAAPAMTKPAAIEQDHFIELRVPFDEPCAGGSNHP